MDTTIRDTSTRQVYQGNPNAARLETSGQPGGDDIRMPKESFGQSVGDKIDKIINFGAHIANFAYTTIVSGKADRAQLTADKALALGQKNEAAISELQTKPAEEIDDSTLDKIVENITKNFKGAKGAIPDAGDLKRFLQGLLKHTTVGSLNSLFSLLGQDMGRQTAGNTFNSVLGNALAGSFFGGIIAAMISGSAAAASHKSEKEVARDAVAGLLQTMAASGITVGAEFLAPAAVAAVGGPIPFTIAAGVGLWLAYQAVYN
jgi:hypothetical protein